MTSPRSPTSFPPSYSPRRRLSVQLPGSPREIAVPSPRAVPLPVPQRAGSISVHNGSFGGTSYGSVSDLSSLSPRNWSSGHRASGSFGGGSASLSSSFVLGPSITTDDSDSWLDVTAAEVARDSSKVLSGDTGLEEATEVLINGQQSAIIVQTGSGGYGLFDFADLNSVLLLVLAASATSAQSPTDVLDERSRQVVTALKRGIRIGVGTVCDISGKNPCTSFPPSTPLRRLLPMFASGVHRVVVTSNPPTILSATALLAFLTRRPPSLLRQPLSESSMPLHPLVSMPASASVLDAMQVMSVNGLGALGVVSGDSDRDAELSSLVGIVTVIDCSKLVVPSEGKQALGMGLGHMCKNVLAGQGRERGNERVPVHTVTPSTSLLHAANLILATSSSRVIMRAPPASSPPLSPVSSFEHISPPPSPPLAPVSFGLPTPPPAQLSHQYVISILDIIACLARACQSKLSHDQPSPGGESWDMLPDNMSKRRRRASSSSASAFAGFDTWRWADGAQFGG